MLIPLRHLAAKEYCSSGSCGVPFPWSYICLAYIGQTLQIRMFYSLFWTVPKQLWHNRALALAGFTGIETFLPNTLFVLHFVLSVFVQAPPFTRSLWNKTWLVYLGDNKVLLNEKIDFHRELVLTFFPLLGQLKKKRKTKLSSQAWGPHSAGYRKKATLRTCRGINWGIVEDKLKEDMP